MNYITIKKGDIIRVLIDKYIDFQGGKYQDHFVKKAVLYRVKTEPTNNGNFTALTSTGKLKHFNILNKNIIAVYPKH